MKDYFNNLSDEQLKQLFDTLGFRTYPSGYGQGTTTMKMQDNSTVYYAYNRDIGYSKAAYFKKYDIRITRKNQNKTFDEIPLSKTHLIKYFKFMIDVFGAEYYLNAVAYWGDNIKMLALLYQAKTGKTEKDDELLAL